MNPRTCVPQCTRSSVVVAKEKIVQQTMLERQREHLKAYFAEHSRPSSSSSEVSKHINKDNPSHNIKLANTQILDRDPNWFARGVWEAIYMRAHKPTLNRDGGRYKLPAIWNRLIWSQVTWPVKSHQQWLRLQLEPKALNQTSSCVVSKTHNFCFFVKLLSYTTKLQSL